MITFAYFQHLLIVICIQVNPMLLHCPYKLHKTMQKRTLITVEPRLSGPRLSGLFDYPDFFLGSQFFHEYELVAILRPELKVFTWKYVQAVSISQLK